MSKKGGCYDNAAMESWNHSLKVEAINGARFIMRKMAMAHGVRLHRSLLQSASPVLMAWVSVAKNVRGTPSGIM
jgi:transposase InsO family protein